MKTILIVAMVCITYLLSVALFLGHNGLLLSLGVTAIGTLAGIPIGAKVTSKNKP